MGMQFTRELLAYATCVATLYRLFRVSTESGYSYELHQLSDLKQMAEATILPEPLAKFIESIGSVTHEHSVYVPHIRNFQYYRRMLCTARLHIPDDFKSDRPDDHYIDHEAFIGYLESTGRGYKSGVRMRKVAPTLDGTAEFLAAYRGEVDEATAYYPSMGVESLAQLGAAYRLRNVENRDVWFGHRDSITYNFISDTYDQALLLSQVTIDTVSVAK
jgi:hypothetical protein